MHCLQEFAECRNVKYWKLLYSSLHGSFVYYVFGCQSIHTFMQVLSVRYVLLQGHQMRCFLLVAVYHGIAAVGTCLFSCAQLNQAQSFSKGAIWIVRNPLPYLMLPFVMPCKQVNRDLAGYYFEPLSFSFLVHLPRFTHNIHFCTWNVRVGLTPCGSLCVVFAHYVFATTKRFVVLHVFTDKCRHNERSCEKVPNVLLFKHILCT